MYTVYHFPFSQHSRRVVALLEAESIEYKIREVAMDDGEHVSEEYLAINPNHQIPALVAGDTTLLESNAILRFLCNAHGLTRWYPEEALARAAVDQWLDWNQCRFSPVVVDIVLNAAFMGEEGDQEAVRRGRERLPELLEILEHQLSLHDFISSSSPTIADLSIASNITHLDFSNDSPSTPNISRWRERMCSIPGFAKTMPSMG